MRCFAFILKNHKLLLIGLLLFCFVVCSTDSDSDPAGYVNANGIRGGQLYDKFWATETGWSQTDPNLGTYNAYADFFRCKQCHGWDLLGSKGSYISRGPKNNRPNVSSLDLQSYTQDKSPQELFDAIKKSGGRRSITADLSTYEPSTNPTIGDQMPYFRAVFSDEQIWDLVKFLKEEAIDVDNLYDSQLTGTYPTGKFTYSNIGKDGNAANGNQIYAAKCTSCHGADGRMILVDGSTYTIGSFIRAKPNEGQHKIKFGQLGTTMGGLVTDLEDMKDLYKAMGDVNTFPNP